MLPGPLSARRVIRMDAPLTRYQLKRFKYNSHHWILKLLEDADRPLRILDIGTAAGYLGMILKERGHYVAGVECDADFAQQARAFYDRFYQLDIGDFVPPDGDEYDCIIFADVLEHLPDPAAVLRRYRAALKRDGTMIISVPNVANIFIRLSLLFGRFDYADRGILDRTHLRFFTLRSLKQLLQECGLDIRRILATPIPLQLVWPVTDRRSFALVHDCHYLMVRLWKTLFAYQFVVEADGGRRPL